MTHAHVSDDRSVPLPRAIMGHIPALDGVRALAFLFVFFDHWSLVWGWSSGKPTGILLAILKLANVGWCGVDLFFVLSGFLITGILLDTRGERDYFSNFYLRRTLRIFPLYYAFLVVVFVVMRPFVAGTAGYGDFASGQFWYWAYLQNWSTALYHWPRFGGVDHLWSLAVEEQFYLVWPLVVLLGGRVWTRRASVALVALAFALRLAVAHRRPDFAYASTITRVDALVAGAWVATVVREQGGMDLLKRAAVPVLAFALVGLAVLGAARHGLEKLDPPVDIWGFSLFAALFAGAVAFVITRPADHAVLRALALPKLRELGKVSYAAYLFHYPAMRIVDAAMPSSFSMNARLGFGFVGSAILTLVASRTSWRFLESPLLRFKDHVSPPSSVRVRSRGAESGEPLEAARKASLES